VAHFERKHIARGESESGAWRRPTLFKGSPRRGRMGPTGDHASKEGGGGGLEPCTTLVDLQVKLADDSRPPVADVSQYRGIAKTLQYLTFTRPDIAYAMQQICLRMHDPQKPHLTAMKYILRYFVRRLTSACYCAARPALTWSSTPTPIGLPARTLIAPRRAMSCS
jgi:hypothetical protein